MALLMAVKEWDFKRAAQAVERHLGLPSTISPQRAPGAPSSLQEPASPPPGSITLARLPEPLPEAPPDHLPAGHKLTYGPDQWTEWEDGSRPGKDGQLKSKGERPRHRDASGKIQYSAGSDPWSLFGAELLHHAQGQWIAAAEGPKCARWLQAGGLVAVSQPGHDHKDQSIQRRFRDLLSAGVAGMLYLSDHDDTGRNKADQLARCAAAVGFPFMHLPAVAAWTDIPEKGSIDDAPGTAAERVAAIEQAIAQGKPKPLVVEQQQEPGEQRGQRDPKTKKELQDFLSRRHTFERDELLDLPVIDGEHVSARFIPRYDQFLADRYGLEFHPRTAEGVLRYLCDRSPFNPVARYLQAAAVSTEARLLSLQEIGHAFGIADEDIVSLDALARHLVGALKRGLQPGYKHDQVLILSGGQGFLKSEAITALVPHTGWTDSESGVPKFEEWPFLIRLSSCWQFVFDECDRMLRGKHSSEVKGLVTRRHDQWARKGETEKTNHPRRCVMWGTTNEEHGILNDPTGVRRIWIAFVQHPCNPGWIARNRDSIWATVMTWASAGGINFYPQGDPLEAALRERAWAASFESVYAPQLHLALDALPVRDGFAGITQHDLVLRALGKNLEGICDRRERLDLIEEVSRAVTAANFTTHGGQWRWRKQRKRYGLPNAVAGFEPVPSSENPARAAAAGDHLPAGFLVEPEIPVSTCAGLVPTPRHGHSPWGATEVRDCADRVKEKEVLPREGQTDRSQIRPSVRLTPSPREYLQKVDTPDTVADSPSSPMEVTVSTPPHRPAQGSAQHPNQPTSAAGSGLSPPPAAPSTSKLMAAQNNATSTTMHRPSSLMALVRDRADAEGNQVEALPQIATADDQPQGAIPDEPPPAGESPAPSPGAEAPLRFDEGDLVDVFAEGPQEWLPGYRIAAVEKTTQGVKVRVKEVEGVDWRILSADQIRRHTDHRQAA
ncbi:VapE domain-containing protein [Synechococcus sp. CS-205]|uniref:VapE domain-containing protein n=1 Tax=Synechococcus sp. CS-205 TaxID=2847984 RepID=UPI00223AE3C1|nr:VapE domain-containing protein [Synechococcus sp. CS-205]